jgi:phosphonate transport system substrate-binding protein
MTTTKMGSALVLLALTTGVALAGTPAEMPKDSTRPFIFGVVPQFEPRRLHAAWEPILAELGRRTRHRFEFATTLTISDFEKELAAGHYDFVYANPFQILNEIGKQRYEPLVRDQIPLRGILVVRRDSPIQGPADLGGKVVAMPSPNSLGASLLVRADLERVHHTTVKPLYVKTHSSVYLHVAKGLADAGGGVERTLQEQDPAIRDLLRVIYTTRSTPSHPVAAHPRVPKKDKEAVRRAFLELAETAAGKELLARVPMKQLTSASMAEYQVLLTWGLQAYWDSTWKDDRRPPHR